MKITTIGTALIDIYLSGENFTLKKRQDEILLCQTYGQKIELADHDVFSGGAATNTAVGFARRGHDVSIIAELGRDDFAYMLKNELIKEKVNTKYIIQEKLEKTGCSVILRGAHGGRTILVSRSASALLDDYDIPLPHLAERDWIHLSSLGGNLNALSEIWQVFDQKDLGLSWNPGSKELAALAAGSLNLPEVKRGMFFVNDHEWAQVKALQKDILHAFTHVIITAGGKPGQIYVSGQLAHEFTPDPSIPVYDETGAGDSFATAFVSTILYARPVAEALTAALNNAASVIQHLGAKKGLLSY